MILSFLMCILDLGSADEWRWFPVAFLHEQLDMNGLPNATHMNGLFYTPLSFTQTKVYFEPSFICCQVHYSRTCVLILAMTPGLDCETYCVTVTHVSRDSTKC